MESRAETGSETGSETVSETGSEDVVRRGYPSDVSDEEWAFVAPYLTLMRADAPQRMHDLRAVFNGLRWLARSAPNDPYLRSYWTALGDGLPYDRAFRRTFGISLEEFYARFEAFRQNGYR